MYRLRARTLTHSLTHSPALFRTSFCKTTKPGTSYIFVALNKGVVVVLPMAQNKNHYRVIKPAAFCLLTLCVVVLFYVVAFVFFFLYSRVAVVCETYLIR